MRGRESHLPCVPYFALILKDFVYIKDGSPTYFKENVNGGDNGINTRDSPKFSLPAEKNGYFFVCFFCLFFLFVVLLVFCCFVVLFFCCFVVLLFCCCFIVVLLLFCCCFFLCFCFLKEKKRKEEN